MAFVLVECAITLALKGVADLSEVVEHVSWTRSHTAWSLYLAKVFNPDGATPAGIVLEPLQDVDRCDFPTSRKKKLPQFG